MHEYCFEFSLYFPARMQKTSCVLLPPPFFFCTCNRMYRFFTKSVLSKALNDYSTQLAICEICATPFSFLFFLGKFILLCNISQMVFENSVFPLGSYILNKIQVSCGLSVLDLQRRTEVSVLKCKIGSVKTCTLSSFTLSLNLHETTRKITSDLGVWCHYYVIIMQMALKSP